MLILQNINLVQGLRCVKGILFIRLMLKRIKIAKQLFTFEIEQGSEAYIPRELSQKSLPLSFKFYDPMMKMVQELISDDIQDFLLQKNEQELEVLKKVDAKNRFLEQMGLRETQDENIKKLTFKPQALHQRTHNSINILDSLHSLGVQSSNYIQIDNDLMYKIHLDPDKLAKMNQNSKKRPLSPGESLDDQNPIN